MPKKQSPLCKEDIQNVKKALDKHFEHLRTWEPRNTHLIPPILKTKDYRYFMEAIEEEILTWTWDMFYAAYEPGVAIILTEYRDEMHRQMDERFKPKKK